MHKSKYNCKYAKVVQETGEKKEYFKQLFLKNGFKIADLIQKSKYRFELIIKLIIIKCLRGFLYNQSLFIIIWLLERKALETEIMWRQ